MSAAIAPPRTPRCARWTAAVGDGHTAADHSMAKHGAGVTDVGHVQPVPRESPEQAAGAHSSNRGGFIPRAPSPAAAPLVTPLPRAMALHPCTCAPACSIDAEGSSRGRYLLRRAATLPLPGALLARREHGKRRHWPDPPSAPCATTAQAHPLPCRRPSSGPEALPHLREREREALLRHRPDQPELRSPGHTFHASSHPALSSWRPTGLWCEAATLWRRRRVRWRRWSQWPRAILIPQAGMRNATGGRFLFRGGGRVPPGNFSSGAGWVWRRQREGDDEVTCGRR